MRYGKGAVEVRVSYAALNLNVFDGKLQKRQRESSHPEGREAEELQKEEQRGGCGGPVPASIRPLSNGYGGTRAGTAS